MTDITELAQREKFEAWDEEAGALPWGILKKHRNKDGNYPGPHYTYMWKAWQAASAELVEALEKAQAINAAAEKLVRCKGRYHSEQNYRALAALFGVTTPDLPPLDGESSTVTVKLPTTRLWAGVTECYEKSDVIAAIRSAGMEVSDD